MEGSHERSNRVILIPMINVRQGGISCPSACQQDMGMIFFCERQIYVLGGFFYSVFLGMAISAAVGVISVKILNHLKLNEEIVAHSQGYSFYPCHESVLPLRLSPAPSDAVSIGGQG